MRVTIIGLGQIGASIGLDLVTARLVAEVVGFDSTPGVAIKAIQAGAIDRDAASLEEAVHGTDMIVLAMPIRQIVRMIPLLADVFPPDCTIVDVAGTKTEIMRVVGENGLARRYISAHPMAGDEGSGLEAASLSKFMGKQVALTVAGSVDPERLETVCRLVRSLGAQPFLIEAERHDQLIAQTSHLPYAVAISLSNIVAEEAAGDDTPPRLVGGSFRSATRVAGSSPELTTDMLLTNPKPVCAAIDLLIDRLQQLRTMVHSSAESEIQQEAKRARDFRRSIEDD